MKIIIVGGGFAGLELARKLNNKAEFDVLLIDQLIAHQFQPLFYQVATGGLEPSNISFPLRKVFHNSKNVRIRITKVMGIHADSNEIATDTGTYGYDVLVLATGCTTNFFGNEKLASFALPMKSTLEALQLLNRIINNYEDALDAQTDEERKKRMSIVIAGAGPTGVELAGALSEMRSKVLPKDYPDLDLKLMDIYLLDAGTMPLARMSAQSSADAKHYLEEMGILLKPTTTVKDYDGENVLLSDGSLIRSKTLIWAAGVKGNVPAGIQPELILKGNRIKVDQYSRVAMAPNMYAIGDIAGMATSQYPHGHPQLASVAKSQAIHLARNLERQLAGAPLREYEFKNKGTMATIGRGKAVVDLPKPNIHIKGLLAWYSWMLLHLLLLYGAKNRFIVFVNWVYKFFTYDQSLRLADRYYGRLQKVELGEEKEKTEVL